MNWQDMLVDLTSPAPVYQQVYQAMKEHIKSGKLSPGACLPSERHLIAEFGIARPTLRQALARLEQEGLIQRRQGAGTFVNPPKRWRIPRRTLTLGIVSWGPSVGGYLKDVFSQVCTEALSRDIQVKTLIHDEGNDLLAERVGKEGVDGMLVLPTASRRGYEQLRLVRLPKAIFEIRWPQEGMDHVIADSLVGVSEGVEELIRLGHREMAFVGALLRDRDAGPGAPKRLAPDVEVRFAAYRHALDDAGLPYDPAWYAELPFDEEPVYAWVRERVHAGTLPRALVAFDDLLAKLLIEGLELAGLRVPEDVSVLGYGNLLPESQSGRIATVAYDPKELAVRAIQRLYERMVNGGIAGLTLSVPTAFKPGGSIGPAPKRDGVIGEALA